MILLTGASGGIGKQLLPHLIQLDDIIGIYKSQKPSLIGTDEVDLKAKNSEETAGFDKRTSNTLDFVKLDITDSRDVSNFVKENTERLTKITIVHLAGIKKDGLAAQYSEKDFDQAYDVNTKGVFLLTKALLPKMINEKWGRVLSMTSHGGLEGDIGTIGYSSSKHALLGVSRVLSKEYARFNITSNVIELGTFDTGMFQALPINVQKKILASIPTRKCGDVSNIAHAISFCIKAEYVNGAIIPVNGGI